VKQEQKVEGLAAAFTDEPPERRLCSFARRVLEKASANRGAAAAALSRGPEKILKGLLWGRRFIAGGLLIS